MSDRKDDPRTGGELADALGRDHDARDATADHLAELAALPPPVPPPVPPALETELAGLAPVVMRRPARQLGVLLALSLVYGVAMFAIIRLRTDADELPMPWMVAAAGGWLLGFVVPCYLALIPRAHAITPRWRIAAISAVVASIGFVILGLVVHPTGAVHSVEYGSARFAHGHWCLELGLAVAIVPVVIGAIFLRGALPVGARWTAAALGAGGGSLGGLVLHLHCHITDALHVGLIHGGVVGVSALLAAALVPRATDVR